MLPRWGRGVAAGGPAAPDDPLVNGTEGDRRATACGRRRTEAGRPTPDRGVGARVRHRRRRRSQGDGGAFWPATTTCRRTGGDGRRGWVPATSRSSVTGDRPLGSPRCRGRSHRLRPRRDRARRTGSGRHPHSGRAPRAEDAQVPATVMFERTELAMKQRCGVPVKAGRRRRARPLQVITGCSSTSVMASTPSSTRPIVATVPPR